MELDCGIRQERIVSWLSDELSLRRNGNLWTFSCAEGSCSVGVSPLPVRTLGKLRLERTLVSFNGDPTAVDRLAHLFKLRFMSAGG